jgi:hypothetical protein
MRSAKPHSPLLLTLFSAILFTLMFYDKTWGLNLFIFHAFWLTMSSWGKIGAMTKTQLILGLGALLSVVFTFFQHTYIGFYVSFLSVFMYSVSMSSKKLTSLHFVFISFLSSIFKSYAQLLQQNSELGSSIGLPTKKLKRAFMFIIPLFVLILFFNLYAIANPSFGAMSQSFFDGFDQFFNWFSKHMQWNVIGYVLLGLMLSIPFFYPKAEAFFEQKDESNSGFLIRKRAKWLSHSKKTTSLIDELKIGVFLLVGLNLMLSLLLVFEIKDVWFGFQWNGQYLKEFVHEGMHVLSFAIVISMAVALYFFRGNLNFFERSALLKKLTYTWLFLNAVLVLSVAIRDFWYIHYFALAYKRIALLFFLAATFVGLISVYFKIKKTRNSLFLLRVNSLSIYALLVIATFCNWDRLIAQYNFSNPDRAFVHLDYLSTLSDAALPYLQVEGLNLEEIEVKQRDRLGESSYSYGSKYITANNYQQMINLKTDKFYYDWSRKSWLEWNVSEWWAHRQLKPKMEGE